MMRPPSRIHHANKRNPIVDAVISKSDSPGACIRAVGTNAIVDIGSSNSGFIKSVDCAIISEKMFDGRTGKIDSECASGNSGSIPQCTSTRPLTEDETSFVYPDDLAWVANWTNTTFPKSYCNSLPDDGQLIDGRVYCINSDVQLSGKGALLEGSNASNNQGNTIIIGPNGSLRFRGNGGFNFDARTNVTVPNMPNSTIPEALIGVAVYAPFSTIDYGGNATTTVRGCGGIIVNKFNFNGGANLTLECDLATLGSNQEVFPNSVTPISISF